MTHGVGRVASDAGKLVITLLGAAFVGGAVPAGWIALAGVLQSLWGGSGLTFTAIGVIFAGILGTYYAIIWIAARVAVRRLPADRLEQPRHHNWNRAMSDERHRPPPLSLLESVFVWTAILATAAYLVWFLLFAGSPLPAG